MAGNKDGEMSLRAALGLTLRGVRLLWGLNRRYYIATGLEMVVTTLTPYVTIWLSARIINELSLGRDPQVLTRLVLLTLLLTAGLTLLGGVLTRWRRYEEKALRQKENAVYPGKMMDLDYADVDRQEVYELYNRIVQNGNFQGYGLNNGSNRLIESGRALLKLLGGVALSVTLFTSRVPQGSPVALLDHPLCAAAVIGALLGVALLAPVCLNRGNSYWGRANELGKEGNRYFGFYGFFCWDKERAADIRMYRQQDRVCEPYMGADKTFMPEGRLAAWCRGPAGLWLGLGAAVSAALTGLVYLFVCLKAWGGAFGVGMVTQYVGAVTGLFSGLSDLLQGLEEVRLNARLGLTTIYEFLDLPNRMYQGSLTTEKRSDRQYEVEFRDVSFRYPGTDAWSLRHVSMRFRVGERLAIVGENGSGKTTFIKLLCRLYDPTEGEILLNGIDIRKYNYDDYMSIFSMVFQDFQLFALPLGENVAGRRDYDRARAERCLDEAGFSHRLARMPRGLDTCLYKELDKEGVEVSGGEAQKIAIARALYKDAPFLVLDEPTAALDPVAEAEIYSRLGGIVGDKTAIFISHRLSSCRFCDEIAVFHGGQVVQQGSHDALLREQSGKYSELWHAQAYYYTEEA